MKVLSQLLYASLYDFVSSNEVILNTLALEHLHFLVVAELLQASSVINNLTIASLKSGEAVCAFLNPIKEPSSGQTKRHA